MDKAQRINKRFYNSHSRLWAEKHINSFWYEKQFKKFITHFKKGDRVIDVGCAWGIHAPMFLGVGRKLRYEGMDISPKMVNIAKRRFPQLYFREGNILDVRRLPRRKYDGFFAGAVLMHIPEKQWPALLKNLETIIKPKGIGYITLPQMRPNPQSRRDQRPFSFWSKEKLKKYITVRRWKILDSGKMPDSPGKWLWFILKLP